jgi:hypothetical protein
MWERGEPSADMFGVLKRQLQHQAEAALPHSTIPLSRLAGEGDKADKGTSLGFTVCEVRPLSALTPSPSPTAWERGAAR